MSESEASQGRPGTLDAGLSGFNSNPPASSSNSPGRLGPDTTQPLPQHRHLSSSKSGRKLSQLRLTEHPQREEPKKKHLPQLMEPPSRRGRRKLPPPTEPLQTLLLPLTEHLLKREQRRPPQPLPPQPTELPSRPTLDTEQLLLPSPLFPPLPL